MDLTSTPCCCVVSHQTQEKKDEEQAPHTTRVLQEKADLVKQI